MTNLTGSNSTNVAIKFFHSTMEGETQDVANEVGLVMTVVINSVTSPFTVLLNLSMIMAVKRRTSLQSNANILLACLAVTDALTGLIAQPSFFLWRTLLLLGSNHLTVNDFHDTSVRILCICSCLHLMLVVAERLVAIKFTFYYPHIVTKRNIKLAVILCWIYSISAQIGRDLVNLYIVRFLLGFPVLLSCIVFVSSSYVLLYDETLRHRKMIKNQ